MNCTCSEVAVFRRTDCHSDCSRVTPLESRDDLARMSCELPRGAGSRLRTARGVGDNCEFGVVYGDALVRAIRV